MMKTCFFYSERGVAVLDVEKWDNHHFIVINV